MEGNISHEPTLSEEVNGTVLSLEVGEYGPSTQWRPPLLCLLVRAQWDLKFMAKEAISPLTLWCFETKDALA